MMPDQPRSACALEQLPFKLPIRFGSPSYGRIEKADTSEAPALRREEHASSLGPGSLHPPHPSRLIQPVLIGCSRDQPNVLVSVASEMERVALRVVEEFPIVKHLLDTPVSCRRSVEGSNDLHCEPVYVTELLHVLLRERFVEYGE